jgi:hypothetical protein
MSVQTVSIEVDPRSAAILAALKEKAVSQGVSLDDLLTNLTEGIPGLQSMMITPEEKAEDFLSWVKAHSVSGSTANDSRESIYSREDETL